MGIPFVLTLTTFGLLAGLFADALGFAGVFRNNTESLLGGAALGVIAGIALYYPMWLVFAVLNYLFGYPLVVVLMVTCSGAIFGLALFRNRFGPPPTDSTVQLFHSEIRLYPEHLALTLLMTSLFALGWYALSNRPPRDTPPKPRISSTQAVRESKLPPIDVMEMQNVLSKSQRSQSMVYKISDTLTVYSLLMLQPRRKI